MAETLKFRDNFSGIVNLKGGGIAILGAGATLTDNLTDRPLVLADGEEDRLRVLGAFDIDETHPSLLVPPGVAPPVIRKNPPQPPAEEPKAAAKAAATKAATKAD